MLIPKQPNLRGTPLERRYFAWLGGFPCCLSQRPDGVQLAHTGDVTTGKGVGFKTGPDTVLPLHHALHAMEEKGRQWFWSGALGESPLPWAERLFDIFEKDDREGAEILLMDMHEQADKAFLRMLFERAA